MRLLALRCLGDLLATHPHFNFRTNIIATIAPYMNSNNNEVHFTSHGGYYHILYAWYIWYIPSILYYEFKSG